MSKVQSPDSKKTVQVDADLNQTDFGPSTLDLGLIEEPTSEEYSVLSPFERFAFRFVRRMNQGNWKRFWTWCQSLFGAGWIHFATYNIMNIYGLENVEAASRDRPILLVANHRS